MSKHFLYSLLKYTHSQVLEETFNVGILFFCPDTKEVRFLYPEKLDRVRKLYPNFSENLLKEYLKGFKSQALRISREIKFEEDFNILINDYFLPIDATFLSFSKPKKVILDKNIDEYIKLYYHKYFSVYDVNASTTQKIDEKFIIKNFKSQIENLKNDKIKDRIKIREDIIKMQYTDLKTDGYWLNGNRHYLKALSFDLKKPIEIDNKVNIINSKLNLLSKELTEFNYCIDILVAKPQENSLNKDFQKAMKILESSDKKIVAVYDSVSEYASFTAKCIEQSFK